MRISPELGKRGEIKGSGVVSSNRAPIHLLEMTPVPTPVPFNFPEHSRHSVAGGYSTKTAISFVSTAVVLGSDSWYATPPKMSIATAKSAGADVAICCVPSQRMAIR
jgi:hypothetical protein